MNLSKLKRVNRATTKRRIDLLTNCAFAKSVIVTGEKLSSGLSVGKKIKSVICKKDLTEMVVVDDQIFMLDTFNNVYKIKENRMEFITKTSINKLDIVSTDLYMHKSYAINCFGGVLFLGKVNKYINTPNFTGLTEYKGRLFAHDNFKLYYVDLSAVEDNKQKIYTINLSEEYGKVISTIQANGDLYVVCENTILKIYNEGELDFIIHPTKLSNLSIKPNSVQKINSGIVFISGNEVCAYNGANLNRENLENVNLNDLKNTYIVNDKYIIALNNFKHVVYDISSKNNYYIDLKKCLLTNSLTYLNLEDFSLCELGYNCSCQREYKTKEITFDGGEEKVFKRLIIDTKSNVAVTVKGPFVDVKGIINRQINTLEIGKQSKYVQLEIISFDSHFEVNKIYIETQNLGG